MHRLTNADVPCDTERGLVCLVGSNRLRHGLTIVGQRAVRYFGLLASQQPPVVGGTALAGAVFSTEVFSMSPRGSVCAPRRHCRAFRDVCVARARPFLTPRQFGAICTCTIDKQLGINGEVATNRERPLPDDLGDFLCGRADAQTRDRIGSTLDDPSSDLRCASGLMGSERVPRR